jgi:hypothetical protein
MSFRPVKRGLVNRASRVRPSGSAGGLAEGFGLANVRGPPAACEEPETPGGKVGMAWRGWESVAWLSGVKLRNERQAPRCPCLAGLNRCTVPASGAGKTNVFEGFSVCSRPALRKLLRAFLVHCETARPKMFRWASVIASPAVATPRLGRGAGTATRQAKSGRGGENARRDLS